ncbi:hypothetical protein PLICRDRAFT_96298, partial [Plicaturopsis crispa FD-325 SS-3]
MTAEEDTESLKLLESLDLSETLTEEQRQGITKVILANQRAFGLDGRLGHHNARVDIPLLPGTKPISLSGFPSSPAKREVIDKQMDAWIALGVIEPSRSPWAAPGFIVYRNGKPRM